MNDGKFRFPNSSLMIGTAFEAGGCYEDWGFVVYQRTKDGINRLAEGRNVEDAIKKAQKKLSCDHVWEKNGWCNKCHGHKTFLSNENTTD